MKQDINNRADIKLLVDAFYNKVKTDKQIGYFFTEVVKINWEKHLPAMYNFWENILFFTGNYEGNPMNLHLHLSKITTIDRKHFNRWNKLFTSTVDELFEGEKATLLKNKAISIAGIIQKNIFVKK